MSYVYVYCCNESDSATHFGSKDVPTMMINVVADPGFPRRGAPTPQALGKNLLFGKFFCENYMKIKENGSKQRASLASPPPTTGSSNETEIPW